MLHHCVCMSVDMQLYVIEVLSKMKTKCIIIHTVTKRKIKFLEYIMRRQGLVNLTHSGLIEGERCREKE